MRRDLDNMPKAILDALETAELFMDDNQVDQLIVERCDIVSGGAVKVRIFEYGL